MLERVRPWILIVIGGVILPISFCGFDQWYLTWIAFVPLLGAIEGATRKQAALRGFVYGLIANLIGYYWIPYTIHEFGNFPQSAAWAFGVILCSYQGIQYSLLAYLVVRLTERIEKKGESGPNGQKHSLLFVVPASMVCLETVYPLLFPIFMGNTQHPIPLLIQACDLLGPLLITAIILLFNASVYIAIRDALRKNPIPWKQVAAGPIGLVFLIVYGLIRMPTVDSAVEAGTELRVGVVQPSMGILEKWRDVEEGLRRHNDASLDLERRGADLIVWSEAAFTAGLVRHNERNLRELMVPRLRTPMIAGALRWNYIEGRQRPVRHNSAFMLDAEGNVMGIYDKTYLLAFGEYLPFGDIFPELYEISRNSGRLTPGTSLDSLPFEFEGEQWNIGVLICYEDILPGFTRDLVRKSSPNLLINMTNDAWFGDTNEPWIHLALAKFRAIEHRRYLIRATNTGVSAIVDPNGRVVEQSGVFEQETILSSVRLLRGGGTIYAAVGDVLGYLCVLLIFLGLIRTRKVWFVVPEDQDRQGVRQSQWIILIVAIFDLLSFVFVKITEPAEFVPSGPQNLMWFTTIGASIVAFFLLIKRDPRGLIASWVSCGARMILSFLLISEVSEERLYSTGLLIFVPLGLLLFASINLWFWRNNVKRIKKKAEKTPRKEKKKKSSS